MAISTVPLRTTPALPATGSARVNVGATERIVSTFGGAALTVLGLTRGSLGGVLTSGVGAALLWRGVTGFCPVYGSLGHSTADARDETPPPVEIAQAITVQVPRSEAYAFWRRLENLPRFMHHLRSVVEIGDGRSLWTAKGPGPLPDIEWEARIVEDEKDAFIAWRSLEDADVDNAGHVRFADAPGGGTEVHARIAYHPPAGSAGHALAEWFGPLLGQMVKEDIRRFKRVLEAGELPTIEGQPKGA